MRQTNKTHLTIWKWLALCILFAAIISASFFLEFRIFSIFNKIPGIEDLISARLDEFKTWFPNYYLPAFIIVKSGPILLILIGIWIWLKHRQSLGDILNRLYSWCYYPNFENYWKNFTWFTAIGMGIIGVFLIFYLVCGNFADAGTDHFFHYQRSLSRICLFILSLYLLSLVLRQKEKTKRLWRSFISEPGSPQELAFLRIIFFIFLALFYLSYGGQKAFWNEMDNMVPLPYIGFFQEIFSMPTEWYKGLVNIGFFTALLAAAGISTRAMMLINIPVSFLIIALPNFYGKLSHNQIFIWIPWILAFSNCYNVWSIDALIKKWKNKPFETTPGSQFTLPIRVIWLHFAMIYFFAGVYKLWDCGFDWALSDSMIYQIQTEWVQHYDQVPLPRIDRYPGLVKFGGFMVILFELMFPFLLIKPASRWVAIIGGITFHNTAGHFMKIGFQALQGLYFTLTLSGKSFIPNLEKLYSLLFRKQGHNKIYSKFFNSIFLIIALYILYELLQQNPIFFLLAFGIINLIYHRFSPHNPLKSSLAANKINFHSKYYKYLIVILSLNFVCGLFSIHSYPFSSYPTYSAIVPGEIELLHFEGKDRNGENIEILEIAKSNQFRREDFTVFENQIINAWKKGENTEAQIMDYWKIWTLNNSQLNNVTYLEVRYHKTGVAPEKRKQFIRNELLFSREIQNSNN